MDKPQKNYYRIKFISMPNLWQYYYGYTAEQAIIQAKADRIKLDAPHKVECIDQYTGSFDIAKEWKKLPRKEWYKIHA